MRNDRLLLDAAREVFAAHGASASVALVAARAGLGIGSLYRRYGSKTELLQRLCVLSMQEAVDAATDALELPDAADALAGYIRTCVALRIGSLSPLAGTIETTPEMLSFALRARDLHDRLVKRAHRDGRLRADVTPMDINWLISQFARTSPVAEADDADRILHQRLLGVAIDGLFTAEPSPLPGPPPTTAHYENRWHTARSDAGGPQPPAA
ncbi:TetR/AcrR family transcriptional regulator [Actinospica robiniae]|uniref:TetR/AcrR family transcriptional regulator n=1 Tax=Actinospica robiniae TaxID=304901 RepID=UPI00041FA313|nr:helix-turn-helix domain-containing protein [Actinospica robiniae]